MQLGARAGDDRRLRRHMNESTAIARDLRLNLKRILEDSELETMDRYFALLATAVAVNDGELAGFARTELTSRGAAPEQIQEAAESAAIMAMLNTYYRFRHMVRNDEDYRAAGLRMTGLARPVLGKPRFEALAFAVSVINGCESCIRSHEKALRESGFTPNQIHDLARTAAAVRGIQTLGFNSIMEKELV
jgi:lipoyl-dependent peroxiredoxin subunit D